MKERILDFMLSAYAVTKWPFFSFIEITNGFGEGAKEALNEMYSEGWIAKREGINYKLVELKRFEK